MPMNPEQWLQSNTFHHSQFKDLRSLIEIGRLEFAEPRLEEPP